MGNHRFRLSNMIPNAWFYKIRDMTNKSSRTHSSSHQPTKKTTQTRPACSPKPPISQPRQSYYFTRQPAGSTKPPADSCFLDPPRTSPRLRSRRKTVYRPSPMSESNSDVPELWSPATTLSSSDIVFDVNGRSQMEELSVSELDLPPILTKLPGKSRNSGETEVGSVCVKTRTGVKLRGNSPRIGNPKVQSRGRKSSSSSPAGGKPSKQSFSGSLAVVKASFDPEKDFRESMMEMIVENKIKSSKDLEELLACYLSLNSGEYHGHIIEAFQHIWSDIYSHSSIKL
ncbi:unnamed protein product [Cuscuta campestris]|uniref:Transcription repressor n=1 Tax=Cuscuta campestris TaxID=132261 RepID=A0A484LUB5_9ASTE|nr:unnamed protein product [Cuscuta campestris]